MDIKTFMQKMEQVGKAYQKKEGDNANKDIFLRQTLINFTSFGLTPEDRKKYLCICGKTPYATPWNTLKSIFRNEWLLDIGDEENPICVELCGCWLNLDTQELSATRQIDFINATHYVWIEDYHAISERITWLDLVER